MPRTENPLPIGFTPVPRLDHRPTSGFLASVDWSTPHIAPPSGPACAPSPPLLERAQRAYDWAQRSGMVRNDMLTLIDFSLESTEPRLWIVDAASHQVFAQHLVAHGQGSGDPRDARRARRFSDRDGSHMSSLGLYITGEEYVGQNGRSLRLHGKEPGFNGHAESRHIVVHGARYATQRFIDQNGHLGRSQGCPAIDPAIVDDVIDAIKGGSALFAYAADPEWLSSTTYA